VTDWRVQVNWPEKRVEVLQGISVVRLSPEDAHEVGERLVDAAWNVSGRRGWDLEVTTPDGPRVYSFESERGREHFRNGVKAMGGSCRDVKR
jgi:hypothetical protein